MTVEQMTFLGEEVILRAEKVENKTDIFSTGTTTEKDDVLARFKVIKIGCLQTKLSEGDYVLVNKNGLPKEISIEGIGTIKDTYSLPTHQRIFCKIENE